MAARSQSSAGSASPNFPPPSFDTGLSTTDSFLRRLCHLCTADPLSTAGNYGWGLSHHARFDEIKSALSRYQPEDGINLARCLGSVEFDDSAKLHENMLRVELAEGLHRKVKLPQSGDNETSRLIKAMVNV